VFLPSWGLFLHRSERLQNAIHVIEKTSISYFDRWNRAVAASPLQLPSRQQDAP
jgi:hypothetical protein